MNPLRIYSPGPQIEIVGSGWRKLREGLPSLTNMRGHWGKKDKLAGSHRQIGALLALLALRDGGITKAKLPSPLGIVIWRIGRPRLDSNNVHGSVKSVQDGVAEYLGVGDGIRSGVVWYADQELGDPGVRLEIGRCLP